MLIVLCRCGHCQQLTPTYEKVAANMAGIAPVVAVDCDDAKNKAICSRYGVQGFPTLKAGDCATLGCSFTDFCPQILSCLLFAPRSISLSEVSLAAACRFSGPKPSQTPTPRSTTRRPQTTWVSRLQQPLYNPVPQQLCARFAADPCSFCWMTSLLADKQPG